MNYYEQYLSNTQPLNGVKNGQKIYQQKPHNFSQDNKCALSVQHYLAQKFWQVWKSNLLLLWNENNEINLEIHIDFHLNSNSKTWVVVPTVQRPHLL